MSYLMATNHTLSKRSEIVHNWEDFLIKYFRLCLSDTYDPETNPNGYVNLGTAVNNIANDLIHPKISKPEIWSCDKTLLGYNKNHGIDRLRNALAALMTEMLHTHEPVDPNNLFCTVGVTSSIDLIGHCIADPGDVILVPTPTYSRIYTDLIQRSLVEIWPIPIITKDNNELEPQLTFEKIEAAYNCALSQNKNVRAVLIINPSNPLGDIYSTNLMMKILEFCKREELHVIVDEVYALSIHSDDTNFHSILSFPCLPDPERTHVLYGMSKDFALAGLRIGAIHTKCVLLQKCLFQLADFHQIPYPVQNSAARFWEDLDWCKKFVNTNKQRLRDQFQACKKQLEAMNIPVRNSKAAFFLWADFRKRCQIKSFNEEISFFNYLIEKFRLYIIPGKETFCEEPGWFRITFSIDPKHTKAGLERLSKALEEYKPHMDLNIDLDIITDHKEKETLENLVRSLRNQIKESDWLTENTADKWLQENPNMANAFVKTESEN